MRMESPRFLCLILTMLTNFFFEIGIRIGSRMLEERKVFLMLVVVGDGIFGGCWGIKLGLGFVF